MLEKGLRDVVEKTLKDLGCLQVEFDVPLGRGRARADVVGYIFRRNKMEPVVMVQTQVVYSLEPIYKLMGNADKLSVETMAITDGNQWAWYQKTADDWRRSGEPSKFSDMMAREDIIAYRDYMLSRFLDDLLHTMRQIRRADLGDLGIVLYAYYICKSKQVPAEELRDNPQETLANAMEEYGLASQWSSVGLGQTELAHMISVLEGFSPVRYQVMADGLYEAIYNQTQLGNATHGMLAKAIATLLEILPQGAEVLDPAAGEGAVLAATMLTRGDLQFTAMDENQSTGFLARFLFATQQVGLSYVQRDFVRSNPMDISPVDAIVLDPPLGTRVEAQEVLRQYELSRGKPTPIEVLFIERGISQVKPGGYFVAIVPTALLMRATDKHVREYILRECHVEAVLDIPREFRPSSSVKACLLVCRKKSDDVVPGEHVTMLWLGENCAYEPTEMFRDAIAELVQRLQCGSGQQ